MAFKVKILGFEGNKFTRKQIKSVQNLSERHLSNIAKKTEVVMKKKIKGSIKRAGSTGNLENSIFAEKTSFGWGVGNIEYLNEIAPYWRHVNFGSQAIGALHSHRVPTGGFQSGLLTPSTSNNTSQWTNIGPFSFIPTKPIAPLNYIQKTTAQIQSIVNSVIRRSN